MPESHLRLSRGLEPVSSSPSSAPQCTLPKEPRPATSGSATPSDSPGPPHRPLGVSAGRSLTRPVGRRAGAPHRPGSHVWPLSITPRSRCATSAPTPIFCPRAPWVPNRHPGSARPAIGLRSRQSHNRMTMRGCGESSLLYPAGGRTRRPPFEEARRTALRTTPRSPPLVPGEAVGRGSLRLALRHVDSRRPRNHRESRRTRRSQPRPGSRRRVPRLDHPRTITHESRHSGTPRDEPPAEGEVRSFPFLSASFPPRASTRIAHLPSQSTTATAGRVSPSGTRERPTLADSAKAPGHATASPALPADWPIA